MKSAIVMDGKLRVTENGNVFRIASNGEKLLSILKEEGHAPRLAV